MRIVVVGAGIAGLTAALALSGRGHGIAVIERRTGFGEPGAGIQLSPNATGVLDGLGLGPALARIASEPSGITIRSLRSGREIGRVALGPRMRRLHGAPYLSVARADLHTILLDAARSRPDIRLRVGREVLSVTNEADEIGIGIGSSGGSREEIAADLLIGADGIGSGIRRHLGDGRQPAATGYAAYRATIAAGALPAGFDPQDGGLWLGPGCHLVHYPIDGGRRLNVVAVARRSGVLDGWSQAASRTEVLAGFGRAPREVADLIGSAESWSAWSLCDLPVRSLGSGRTVLIGDAGHPILPYLAQGGALAIEDAGVLGRLLGPDPSAVAEALRAVRHARLGRVRRVQNQARRNGRIYHASGPVALGRDLVMRRLGPDGMTDRYAWIYGWTPP